MKHPVCIPTQNCFTQPFLYYTLFDADLLTKTLKYIIFVQGLSSW